MIKKLLLSTCLTLGTTLGSSALAAQDSIAFGIISTESTSNLKNIWDPFLDDMRKQTGLDVKAFFASDYAGVIEAMRFNKVQVAWYGNKSAMEAVDRAQGEIFAQSVDAEGNPGYWSLVIAHKDSPFNNLDDVLGCDKSLNFGIGDPNSTSGFLVPTTYIFAERGIDPKQCFKTVRNASHEANAMAVANKQVHIATNNTENMRRLQKTAPDAFAKIKVLWQSPLIPSDPLVWRKDLDPGVKAKVYTFIMTYGRLGTDEQIRRARENLVKLQWAPFRPSSDAQLFPIRQLELNKEILKVQNDPKLSADEKRARVATLRKENEMISKQMEAAPNV